MYKYIFTYIYCITPRHTHILLICTLFINSNGVKILIFEEEEGVVFQDSVVLML